MAALCAAACAALRNSVHTASTPSMRRITLRIDEGRLAAATDDAEADEGGVWDSRCVAPHVRRGPHGGRRVDARGLGGVGRAHGL